MSRPRRHPQISAADRVDAKETLVTEAMKLLPQLDRYDTEESKERRGGCESDQRELGDATPFGSMMQIAGERLMSRVGLPIRERLMEVLCFRRSQGYRKAAEDDDAAIEMESLEHVDKEAAPYQAGFNQPIEIFYGTAAEQLSLIGRTTIPVPADGNCMFESIALQISCDSELNDHRVLRYLTVKQGMEHPERYEHFLAGDRERFQDQLDRLCVNGTWDLSVGDVAITMLRDVLRTKIVVIRDYKKQLSFPEDGREIDDQTIVIVRDNFGRHYDATTSKTQKKYQFYKSIDDMPSTSSTFREVEIYGNIEQQLSAIGRSLVEVADSGDCLYESISRQLEESEYNVRYLRTWVYRSGYAKAKKYESCIEGSRAQFYSLLNDINKKGYRSNDTEQLALEILHQELQMKIVLIKDKRKPRHYPADGKAITTNCIVIAQQLHGPLHHFDSTNIRIRKRQYPSKEQQMEEMGRRIPPTFSGESMFSAISPQLAGNILNRMPFTLRNSVSNYAVELIVDHAIRVPIDHDLLVKLAKFIDIKSPHGWYESLAIAIPLFIYRMFGQKIVVLRDYQRPWYFPYNDQRPINDDDVVILQYFYEEGENKGISYYLPTCPIVDYSIVDECPEETSRPAFRRSTIGSLRDRFTRMSMRRKYGEEREHSRRRNQSSDQSEDPIEMADFTRRE